MEILFDIIAILAGFGLLIWSADHFVTGASATARNLGVSPLIIGLTIVGFGTSAPEMLVAAFAAGGGNTNLAIGNAIGSNITNIALVLGATAVFIPLSVHSSILKREYPLLFLSTLLVIAFIALDNHLGRMDGLVFSLVLLAIMYWLVHQSLKTRHTDPIEAEFENEIPSQMPMNKALFMLVTGSIVLLISSKLLVWGAVNIATALQISDLIIGLTIVAIGTSLPELAASIVSAKKGEHDLALGNVVGSNLFNTLGVMGVAGLIHPDQLTDGVVSRDLPIMFILTVILFIIAFGIKGNGIINRFEGATLLAIFVGYETILYFSALG